ncbi:MAG: trehalose-phosphatase [Acidimicrobiales bacterium]|nr:trehalose-phosphatase [Acidimicrobiales bacterium]MCB9392791.1 trehalose-phosphatase [Acidimicrobiaceae bacterium]
MIGDLGNGMDADLEAAIDTAGSARRLLVASDYDGTIAELVDDPDRAHPWSPSIEVLRRLAALPHTTVAVVSGRSLTDLRALSHLGDVAILIGSHGAEFGDGGVDGLDPDVRGALDAVASELDGLAAGVPGAHVERKPAGVAFHTRRADPSAAARAVADVLAGPGSRHGVRVRHGKDVVELTVVHTDKGAALDRLRRSIDADAVVFLGDDLTDEDAFAVLGDGDVGVKVGDGPTIARHRVRDVPAVAQVLSRLHDVREAACTPGS